MECPDIESDFSVWIVWVQLLNWLENMSCMVPARMGLKRCHFWIKISQTEVLQCEGGSSWSNEETWGSKF
jgi:hypothetical protein